MSAAQIVELLTQLNARLDSLRTYENTLIQIMRDRNSQAEIEYTKTNGTRSLVVNITAADEVKAKELFNHVLEKDEGITFK